MKERLQKILSARGVASRRKAEEMLRQGQVSVNGTVAQLGDSADPDADEIRINGQLLPKQEQYIYLMLNKPRGYVTTLSDEKDRPVITDLFTDVEERIFPIGRLDYNTSGLLIMTNDGDLSYRLSHPKHQVYKTYRARVSGVLSAAAEARLRKGVDIGGVGYILRGYENIDKKLVQLGARIERFQVPETF